MRYAVISDIHGNFDALEAVLFAIEKAKADQILCLGDLVGYGPEPQKCIQKIRQIQCIAVQGDFDLMVTENLNTLMKGREIHESLHLAQKNLSPLEMDYLRTLPLVKHLEEASLVHGSLELPSRFSAIQFHLEARACFAHFKSHLCFFGHTHKHVVFFEDGLQIFEAHSLEIPIKKHRKTLINPGSVGFSGKEDLRASFAIYDTQAEKVWIQKVEYDTLKVAEKIKNLGLPKTLSERFSRKHF